MIKLKITIIITAILTIFITTGMVAMAASSGYAIEPEAREDMDLQEQAFLEAIGFNPNMRVGEIVSYIIKLLLSFLGVIFIVLIIYAGFLWMTAAGNEEKISKGKNIMASAIIGLAIVLAAYLITYFVIDNLLLATQGRHL